MAVICPTITAFDADQYKTQMELLETFANRIHIDLMDGEFAPTVSPMPKDVWWPNTLTADIHLMFQRPMEHLEQLIALKPNLVVIQFEADVDHALFARRLHEVGIKAGLSLLQTSTVAAAAHLLDIFDHVMVFSGNLGHHGGSAVDFGLLDKVTHIRALHPTMEIGWDGGISADNARQLIEGGIDVLNVGGFIHKAEHPQTAYATLEAIANSL
jgi:pentose-5-phosphate-3-epimerase